MIILILSYDTVTTSIYAKMTMMAEQKINLPSYSCSHNLRGRTKDDADSKMLNMKITTKATKQQSSNKTTMKT